MGIKKENTAGWKKEAMCLNGDIPGPQNAWQQKHEAIIRSSNTMHCSLGLLVVLIQMMRVPICTLFQRTEGGWSFQCLRCGSDFGSK